MDWTTHNFIKMFILPKLICRFNTISVKSYRNVQAACKIYMEVQRMENRSNEFDKE